MAPRDLQRLAHSLGVALLIALAEGDAAAGELYRWVTKDGLVEIGPTPPPGAAAAPWTPGNEDAARDSVQPESAAPAPAATRAWPAAPARRSSDADAETCAQYREAALELERKIATAEADIARLEEQIEALEASDVAYARTDCVSHDIYGPSRGCQSTSFNRDVELGRAGKALDRAQEMLSDLEARARRASAPPECAPASADER